MTLQPIQAKIFESFQKGKSKADLGCAAPDFIRDQHVRRSIESRRTRDTHTVDPEE